MEVAQHQHGALTRSELSQRHPQFVTGRRELDLVDLGRALSELGDQFGLSSRACGGAADRQVHEHAARVRRWLIHRAHAPPALRHLQQTLRDEILCLACIHRHEVGGSQQALGVGSHERIETRI